MKALLAFALAATFPAAALSATITRTVDFENPETYFKGAGTNFTTDGLRFSPKCFSAHLGHPETSPSGVYMTSDHDNDNCSRLNDNYLGPEGTFPDFFVDREGRKFTLLGLAGLGHDGHTDFAVTSSKGGMFTGSVNIPCLPPYDDCTRIGYGAFTLTGPEWTDITWFMLSNIGETFQQHHGWDDIRYSYDTVAEPGTALLAIGGLAFLAVTRRRRRALKLSAL